MGGKKKPGQKKARLDSAKSAKNKKPGQETTLQQAKSTPLYLLALIVVAALLLGYFVSTLFSPVTEIKLEDIRKKEEKKLSLNAILVFDDKCRVCERNHSFLKVLNENNIGALVAEVPLSTNDGKKIALDFNISQLPVLLIVKNTVTSEMAVNGVSGKTPLAEAMAAIAEEKLEYYVLEEQGFDGKARTLRLLDTSCQQPNLVTVDLFEDPYSPNTTKFKQEIFDARKKLDKNVAFNYNLLPTTTAQLPPGLKENADYLGRAMLCSIDMGLFNEFEKAFYVEYCDANDNNSLDEGELAQCGSSGVAKLPLSKERVNTLVAKAGVPPGFLDICLRERVTDFITGSIAKSRLFLVSSTPTAIVDCKYKTHPKFLPDVICFSKPDLEGCKSQ